MGQISVGKMWPQVVALTLVIMAASLYAASIAAKALRLPPPSPLDVALATALVVVLHESLHAVTAALMGYKFRIGAGRAGPLPVAYVAVRDAVPIGRYRVIALAPLLLTPLLAAVSALVSAVAPEAAVVMLIASALNAGGSSGDLAICLCLTGAPASAKVLDMGAEVEVYGWNPRLHPLLDLVLCYAVCAASIATASLVAAATCGGAASLGGLELARIRTVSSGHSYVVTAEVNPCTLAIAVPLSILAYAGWRGAFKRAPPNRNSVMSGNDADG